MDRIGKFETVLAVAMSDTFPVGSLMRATCTSLVRVERPDGSATEIQNCQLSDEPVMIPAFQGSPPTRTFVHNGGSCRWHSDYWFNTGGIDVLAARASGTPSRRQGTFAPGPSTRPSRSSVTETTAGGAEDARVPDLASWIWQKLHGETVMPRSAEIWVRFGL